MYCRRGGRRLVLAPFRIKGPWPGSSNSGELSIFTSEMVDRRAYDGGEGVRKKTGRKDFATAGGHNQNVIGPQFDVFCLSREYLLNVHSDLLEIRLPGNFANYSRRIRRRRASEPACQRHRAEDGNISLPPQRESTCVLNI